MIILFIFYIYIISIFNCYTQNDNSCFNTHKGILQYHEQKIEHEPFNVLTILKGDTLNFYRGFEFFNSINLKNVITPIVIASTNTDCLIMNILDKEKIELCCTLEDCINHWWLLLTKQILCINQGDMRDETGNKTIESELDKKLNDDFDVISIDVNKDLNELSHVKLKVE